MLNVPLKTCDVLLMNEFVFYLIFYPSSPTLLKHINRCYKRDIELGKTEWKYFYIIFAKPEYVLDEDSLWKYN